MKNTISHAKEYDVPVHPRGEFRHFLSHLRNMFEMPEDLEMQPMEPKIEFSESKDAVSIMAEVPGIDEKDLNVEISSDGFLTISGEKKNQMEHNKEDSYFSEVSYGTFRRTIPLPWDLDYAKADADYDAGVLKIKIPKSNDEKMKTKKLAIKSKNEGNI